MLAEARAAAHERGALLRLDRVSVATADGARQLVDEVSLELDAGQRVGLVGESGSGKSLTALAAIGLAPPGCRITGGSVTLDGNELVGARCELLQSTRGGRVGLVFQEPAGALDPVFTIGFQLVETIRAHRAMPRRQTRTAACRLLAELGLEPPARFLRAYPHQLSGGEAQRATIALALAGQPDLLLADEPTTSLDVTTQGAILELVRGIVEERRLGLLLITHDLAVVAGFVERVLVMYGGEVVEEAPTATLFADPLHPYTRLLLSAASGRPDPRPESPGLRTPAPAGDGCRFAPRCPEATETCRGRRPALERLATERALRCPIVRDRRGGGPR